NTHYHIDHVTGNRIFADTGAVIMAQRNVRGWIHTENMKFFGPHPGPQAARTVANLYAPDLGYIEGIDLDLGGKQLEVRVFPGHTGGDSAVRVLGTGVVFTGDLFWQHSLPNLIDASVAQLLETLPKLQAWPAEGAGIFTPGHGGLGTSSDITAFRGYLLALLQEVRTARAQHLEGVALATAVEAKIAPTYGSWGAYKYFIARNVSDMNAELAGTKHRPVPPAR
ncbi:MAG: MBL fold metallo-hydrolase, partial [Terriglobales bacterium]